MLKPIEQIRNVWYGKDPVATFTAIGYGRALSHLPPLAHWLYDGHACQCVVCGAALKKFARTHRPDHLSCPICGAIDRDRFHFLLTQRIMDLGGERPRRLLHIAPEPVLEAKFRTLRAVEYVSGDLMRPNVTHKVNICNMQFEDQYFDAAFCSHVLEHVPDDRAAMAEFARVLKPEGSVLFSFPQGYAPTAEAPTLADPKERIRRFGQIDHLRLYGPDVVSRFVDAGLSFKEYRPSNICTHAELRAFGFDTEVDLVAYICKPAQS